MANKEKVYHYEKIQNYIIENIKNGTLKRNSMLPREDDLCQMFGVSRMTVNKALSNLADQGYIRRVKGTGSFVRGIAPLKRKSERLLSFTERYENNGIKVTNKLLFYQISEVKDLMERVERIEKLNLKEEDLVHYFARVRLGDGNPISVQYNVVPVKTVPYIEISYLRESFYRYLEEVMNISIGKSYSEVHISSASDEVNQILKIKQGTLTGRLDCVTYTEDNNLLEYSRTYTLAAFFSMEYESSRY